MIISFITKHSACMHKIFHSLKEHILKKASQKSVSKPWPFLEMLLKIISIVVMESYLVQYATVLGSTDTIFYQYIYHCTFPDILTENDLSRILISAKRIKILHKVLYAEFDTISNDVY